jgi:3-hydroxyacyl-[acyl-carrier-protein] dehydratase
MRWFWIDRFDEFVRGRHATAVKNVSLAEEHMHDHFPGAALMPNSLIVEGMAQTAGALAVHASRSSRPSVVYFMTIYKVKFRKPVIPGDRVEFHMTRLNRRRNMWWYRGEAKVDGVLVCEAELSAMLVGEPAAKS